MGTEHFLCMSKSEFVRLSVMKFMLEPVSSRARLIGFSHLIY